MGGVGWERVIFDELENRIGFWWGEDVKKFGEFEIEEIGSLFVG